MTATGPAPRCPSCDGPVTFTALVLAHREEDGKRVCRGVWQCADRHLWWSWADRPGDPLEPCPYPDLFGA
ncbi:dehydrogenase [Streptomyces cocklensis]|uniref:Dehydrogenase n=1 Tax=Actinacidiphila cocklensis TaxID=887465 RepID=A0A9W4GQH1_9ACTN|nr:dehydrogenase [Actinacidiphila cocklensis]MDD1062381.1 dehydrogenase [Actinacidiphila cocklensis]CAG6392669.1 hypothetical protein SCOCK_180046 [Actinacidiphila cocklensis]